MGIPTFLKILWQDFKDGHDRAVRYKHHKWVVHYQRTTLPTYYLEE
jgi:hypothetical protein